MECPLLDKPPTVAPHSEWPVSAQKSHYQGFDIIAMLVESDSPVQTNSEVLTALSRTKI